MKAIGKYTSRAEFDPEKVGQESIAAKSLCMWVIAMEQYAKLYRVVAPKRTRLESALASLHEKEKALGEAVVQLKKLREELEQLREMYDAKMKEKEELIKIVGIKNLFSMTRFDIYFSHCQADELKLKLERAAELVDGLSGERIRWQESVESLGEFFDRLPGDCLISTAFISYLGPFVSNYRQNLRAIWMKEVVAMEIPCTADFDVKDFLSDPTTIREWNIQGLPSDGFSTENGIIITRGIRWPLVIDPQCQAIKWIKNMEANNVRLLFFSNDSFIFNDYFNHRRIYESQILVDMT